MTDRNRREEIIALCSLGLVADDALSAIEDSANGAHLTGRDQRGLQEGIGVLEQVVALRGNALAVSVPSETTIVASVILAGIERGKLLRHLEAMRGLLGEFRGEIDIPGLTEFFDRIAETTLSQTEALLQARRYPTLEAQAGANDKLRLDYAARTADMEPDEPSLAGVVDGVG